MSLGVSDILEPRAGWRTVSSIGTLATSDILQNKSDLARENYWGRLQLPAPSCHVVIFVFTPTHDNCIARANTKTE